jgi:hypothetical protein
VHFYCGAFLIDVASCGGVELVAAALPSCMTMCRLPTFVRLECTPVHPCSGCATRGRQHMGGGGGAFAGVGWPGSSFQRR